MRAHGKIVLLAVAALAAMAPPANAQDNVKLQRDLDAAFADVLRDPANLDASLDHAVLAVKAGNFEAAISSLERMLLYNPRLPSVRLELGVLYFRLGSYTIARSYLTSAVRRADVPSDIKARVQKFLGEIEKRTSRHNFSGSIFSGVRYQSNVNAGPERPAGYAFDTLASVTTRNDDSNFFTAGSVKYVYDPQSETGDVLESHLLAYVSRQGHEKDYDLVYFNGTFGPRGRFMRETFDLVSWRPHISLSYVALANSPYYFSYGAGFDFKKQFSPATTGTLEISMEQRHYRADRDRTAARENSGDIGEITGSVQHLLNSWLRIGGKIGMENTAAEKSKNSSREFTVGVNASVSYDAPVKFGAETWSVKFDTAVADTDYRLSDSDVDSTRKRHDREVRFTVTNTIPIDRRWALSATLERTRVNSNILNYDYTNSSVSIGAALRF